MTYMPTILVLRHSLALANEQRILMGATLDSPLSEKGRELARQKGRFLRAEGFMPDRVYTSQLRRAKETVEIILAELDATPDVIELEGLNERDFGPYDGKPYEFVLDAVARYGNNPPGTEHTDAVLERVLLGLEQIRQETNGVTLVVTHSSPAMVMHEALLNPENLSRYWEMGDPPYCEGFVYEY